MNPAFFVLDNELFERSGEVVLRYSVPFSEPRDLPAEDLAEKRRRGEPLEFGHSLADQIGAQLESGFTLVGFDECQRSEREWQGPLDGHLATYLATCAVKPA
jgi:hypothetical protein